MHAAGWKSVLSFLAGGVLAATACRGHPGLWVGASQSHIGCTHQWHHSLQGGVCWRQGAGVVCGGDRPPCRRACSGPGPARFGCGGLVNACRERGTRHSLNRRSCPGRMISTCWEQYPRPRELTGVIKLFPTELLVTSQASLSFSGSRRAPVHKHMRI